MAQSDDMLRTVCNQRDQVMLDIRKGWLEMTLRYGLFTVVAACLCGCNPNEGCIEVEGNIRATRYTKESFPCLDYKTPTYVEIDGHEYLCVVYDRGLGMTHSPKCSCVEKGIPRKKKKKKRSTR